MQSIFQNQCSVQDIYPGNDAQNSKKFHEIIALRLAFIPDQIVLEYLDKLPNDNQVRKLAMKLISQKSKISNQSYDR